MNSIQEIIEDIRNGKMVILVDDENRENEGDLILAADFVTPPLINFMAKEARGLICLALPSEQIDRLGLPPMVSDSMNRSPNKTAFTVSIEASHGVSTGISAADRAHTVRVASNPLAKPEDIIMPGHVFPIRAQAGGVLRRAGHTEASIDLTRLAGLNSAAVICEIMNEDGSMARVDDLKIFAQKHGIKIGTIEDLIEYRLENESFVTCEFSQRIQNENTSLLLYGFRNTLDQRLHYAFVKGTISENEPALVRVHAENVLSDIFHLQLEGHTPVKEALDILQDCSQGVLVYIRRPLSELPQGLSLHNTSAMDEKDYGVGAQILRALGLKKMTLMTNSPQRRAGLKGYGIEIVGTVPFQKTKNSTPHEKLSSRWSIQ